MSNIDFVSKGRIAQIFINRPETLNALDMETIEELGDIVESVSNNDSIRVLVVSGVGERAFIAGADIKEMLNFSTIEAHKYSTRGQIVFQEIERMPQIVIAAINGFALGGGCELAMACDIRLASEKAKFGQPEINLGIIPGYGGTQRLPRLVGLGKAKEMILTGDLIDAKEAYEIGLVNKVYPADTLMSSTLAMAEQIASKGRFVLQAAKSALNISMEISIVNGCDYEASVFGMCFSDKDQFEGMQAFIDKRKPEFK